MITASDMTMIYAVLVVAPVALLGWAKWLVS